MLFVTGDTHGDHDIAKLRWFASQNLHLTKKDYMIIAGDFGGIWWEKYLEEDLDMYSKLPWTTLFVDGNHENFDLINAYPVEQWKGGKVHRIREDILHLMRGQVFEIEGKRIFTMGGGTSIDKMYRQEGVSWWRQEMITCDDMDEADKNLKACGNQVDYIITHSCAEKVLLRLKLLDRPSKLKVCLDNVFLSTFDPKEEVENKKVEYGHWYFGHYHVDQHVDEKHTALYQSIIRLH